MHLRRPQSEHRPKAGTLILPAAKGVCFGPRVFLPAAKGVCLCISEDLSLSSGFAGPLILSVRSVLQRRGPAAKQTPDARAGVFSEDLSLSTPRLPSCISEDLSLSSGKAGPLILSVRSVLQRRGPLKASFPRPVHSSFRSEQTPDAKAPIPRPGNSFCYRYDALIYSPL